MLVQSRAGGFISQDCLGCGRTSDRIVIEEIPELGCEGCKHVFNPVEVFKGCDRAYWYRCSRCRREWRIWDLLPHWSELFEYAGLSAPGDSSYTPG
jgi:DNA-directed RNA polymerase subunit RPC12/RpoP